MAKDVRHKTVSRTYSAVKRVGATVIPSLKRKKMTTGPNRLRQTKLGHTLELGYLSHGFHEGAYRHSASNVVSAHHCLQGHCAQMSEVFGERAASVVQQRYKTLAVPVSERTLLQHVAHLPDKCRHRGTQALVLRQGHKTTAGTICITSVGPVNVS